MRSIDYLLISVVEEPVGNIVVDGGELVDPIAPVVVGPVPVLDGCPVVVDTDDSLVPEAVIKK